jgi:hypothetical protein
MTDKGSKFNKKTTKELTKRNITSKNKLRKQTQNLNIEKLQTTKISTKAKKIRTLFNIVKSLLNSHQREENIWKNQAKI